MNTTAMILTVIGLSSCFIPGVFGWLGISCAGMGVILGIIGMTNRNTPPPAMGMDVAAWVYGIGTSAAGFGFQIKYAAGALDNLILPIPLNTSALCIAILFPLFVAVQIAARKKRRTAGIVIATILFPIITAATWTALVLADRAGISLV
ncbi:MAG: hypothetical protein JXR76_32460 [Deltaproteobacteria bacterium]|nr:hypothetical protein [Deltaproteobacteria bacterium]